MQSNHLPPLEPIGDFRSYVCGDVMIDQTAAIASGVLIQADQGSRITIAASVCIGMGTVIHAQNGLLEIGAGANLGAGVLVYGTSKIGENCCIGASSSIVRAVISKGAIVPPCSLIVDQAEQTTTLVEKNVAENITEKVTEHILERSQPQTYGQPSINVTSESIAAQPEQSLQSPDMSGSNQIVQTEQVNTFINPLDANISTLTDANSAQSKAYAQSQINRYIKRLFPQN